MSNVQKVLEIVAEILEIEISEITLDTKLDDDNWDSLAVVTFISEIDTEFDIVVSPTQVNNVSTVANLVDLVK